MIWNEDFYDVDLGSSLLASFDWGPVQGTIRG